MSWPEYLPEANGYLPYLVPGNSTLPQGDLEFVTLSLSGGPECVHVINGYLVTLFCSRELWICFRGARACYLVPFMETWIFSRHQWVLKYLILLRGAWLSLRGARHHYLVSFRGPEYVGNSITLTFSVGLEFTSGGAGFITLSCSEDLNTSLKLMGAAWPGPAQGGHGLFLLRGAMVYYLVPLRVARVCLRGAKVYYNGTLFRAFLWLWRQCVLIIITLYLCMRLPVYCVSISIVPRIWNVFHLPLMVCLTMIIPPRGDPDLTTCLVLLPTQGAEGLVSPH